ncbi:MAG: hypothetical protein ACOYXU_09320 [Nitrospirota bacterium]
MKIVYGLATALLLTLSAGPRWAIAQEHPPAGGGVSETDLAKANNPLADLSSINLQNYHSESLYGVPDETTNSFLLRGAMAKGRQLIRVTLPVNTVPTTGEPASGLGDLNVFDIFVLNPQAKTFQYGVGPLLVFPTASDDELGQGKFQVGAAGIIVRALPGGSLFAGLLTWQTDVAGDEDRDDTNYLTFQPNVILQVGGGFYVRSTGVWTRDFKRNVTLIPFGLGIGKVFRVGGLVANVFAEPQLTVYHKGDAQPARQLFTGINFQLPK